MRTVIFYNLKNLKKYRKGFTLLKSNSINLERMNGLAQNTSINGYIVGARKIIINYSINYSEVLSKNSINCY